MPCDIPYIFIHFLAFLCDCQDQAQERALDLGFARSQRLSNYLNDTNNFEEELKSNDCNEANSNASPFSLRKEINFTKEAQELKSRVGNNAIRIMKNELFIDENRFMLGSSTLALVKDLYDFMQLMQMSGENGREIVQKIFELIKVANSPEFRGFFIELTPASATTPTPAS